MEIIERREFSHEKRCPHCTSRFTYEADDIECSYSPAFSYFRTPERFVASVECPVCDRCVEVWVYPEYMKQDHIKLYWDSVKALRDEEEKKLEGVKPEELSWWKRIFR
jgi:Zn ribbon nucleic-acid-binding protein